MTNEIKVGTVTNKGIVDIVFDDKNFSINGELYNSDKHKICVMTEIQNVDEAVKQKKLK